MKTRVFFFFAILAFLASPAKAQLYQKGDHLLDLQIGWPNFVTAMVKSEFNDQTGTSLEIKPLPLGPFGGRFEYLISGHVGIGVYVNYANTIIKQDVFESVYNPATGLNEDQEFHYKLTIPRFRVIPMLNFHLAEEDDIDPYIAIGMGYGYRQVIENSADPYLRNRIKRNVIDDKIYPVSLRAEFGCRYFFTKSFGINGSMALGGGPLLSAGLSAKF